MGEVTLGPVSRDLTRERRFLDFPETPEGFVRYFVAVSEPYLNAGLNRINGNLSQGETKYIVHAPYFSDETIEDAFTSAVALACRQNNSLNFRVISGVVDREDLHQWMMNEAIIIKEDNLHIDTVYSVSPNGPKVDVKRITAEYLS